MESLMKVEAIIRVKVEKDEFEFWEKSVLTPVLRSSRLSAYWSKNQKNCLSVKSSCELVKCSIEMFLKVIQFVATVTNEPECQGDPF